MNYLTGRVFVYSADVSNHSFWHLIFTIFYQKNMSLASSPLFISIFINTLSLLSLNDISLDKVRKGGAEFNFGTFSQFIFNYFIICKSFW